MPNCDNCERCGQWYPLTGKPTDTLPLDDDGDGVDVIIWIKEGREWRAINSHYMDGHFVHEGYGKITHWRYPEKIEPPV